MSYMILTKSHLMIIIEWVLYQKKKYEYYRINLNLYIVSKFDMTRDFF